MNLQFAWELCFRLSCWALLISSLEMLWITRQESFRAVWNSENLDLEFQQGIPLSKNLIEKLLSNGAIGWIAGFEFFLAALGLLLPNPFLAWILLILHLLICFRFRGTFNGGSDMMIFVLLVGLGLACFGWNDQSQKLSLIYIAIHTVFSYFKAGLVKLKVRDWRSGEALPQFLSRSFKPEIRSLSIRLQKQQRLSQIFGLGVIFYEVFSLGLLLMPQFAFGYWALAMVFHFANYIFFGLNRFFWAWLAAWPAVMYALGLINI